MFTLLKLLWKFRKVLLLLAAFQLNETVEQNKPGGKADSPADVSKKGWKVALKRTKEALKDKDLSTSAAGLAYYATITFFPVALGLASIYVVFTSPQQLLDSISNLSNILPEAIASLLNQALSPIGHNGASHAGVALALSIIALLWTTSGGLQNLVKATNKTYEVEETRGAVKLRFTSIALSVVLLIIGSLVVFLLVLSGDALHHWGAPNAVATLFPILRWPILIVLISIVLSAVYRYAPNREEPGWQWVSYGATAATIIWLAATALFFIYVQNFANFNKTYGIFAGIIVLMSWFRITSLIVLVGAQVNKKLETVS